MPYLVQFGSAGCLPDSSIVADTLSEMREAARSYVQDDEQGTWDVVTPLWSVRKYDLVGVSPFSIVYVQEAREHGLGQIWLSWVDDETANEIREYEGY